MKEYLQGSAMAGWRGDFTVALYSGEFIDQMADRNYACIVDWFL